VLDASAVLALLDNEAGADRVAAVLHDSAIGAVNFAEVHSKLAERGRDGVLALAEILAVSHGIVPFTEEHAVLTGSIRGVTSRLGLSLGDRACLALGVALRATVITAERRWAEVALSCLVQLIR
jgi:ribonuclease VapC